MYLRALFTSLVLPLACAVIVFAESPGWVNIPEKAMDVNDYYDATFSDGVYWKLSQPTGSDESFTRFPGELVDDCFAVARIRLRSEKTVLEESGRLVFSCQSEKQNLFVAGWINGRWQKIPFRKLDQGQIQVDLIYLTTYVVLQPPLLARR